MGKRTPLGITEDERTEFGYLGRRPSTPWALATRCKVVLLVCVDEKSQMQTLDRTQPPLPMHPGTPERRRHDYLRHGASSLFAVFMVKTGFVLGECFRLHRHQECTRFLRSIDEVIKASTQVHIVLNNYATHKTSAVKHWSTRHPEFHLHVTPTSASWLNQVERVFGSLTAKQLRRGVFKSVAALKKGDRDYLHERNTDAKPFVWTADASMNLGPVELNCAAISCLGH